MENLSNDKHVQNLSKLLPEDDNMVLKSITVFLQILCCIMTINLMSIKPKRTNLKSEKRSSPSECNKQAGQEKVFDRALLVGGII